jgi:prolactin regulatory element-binding protein
VKRSTHSHLFLHPTSPDGKLIAFSSSDMGLRVCSSKSLQVLMTVPKVHTLPVTSLAFNSDASLLVSGSVDGTCRVVSVPKNFPKSECLLWISMIYYASLLDDLGCKRETSSHVFSMTLPFFSFLDNNFVMLILALLFLFLAGIVQVYQNSLA